MICQIWMQKLKSALEFFSKIQHFVRVYPIGEGPNLLQHQKVWGSICRLIGEGPDLPRPNCRGPICLEPSGWLWMDLKKDLTGLTWAQRDGLLCGCSPASRPTFNRFGLISQLWPDLNTHNSPDQLISKLISKLVWAHWVFYLYWVAQVVVNWLGNLSFTF